MYAPLWADWGVLYLLYVNNERNESIFNTFQLSVLIITFLASVVQSMSSFSHTKTSTGINHWYITAVTAVY